MDYNFDEIPDRIYTNSIKWDTAPDVLPMWVADMDFKTAPAIIEALQNRVAHGIFGYTRTPDQFYTSIINWWEKRQGFTIKPDWIIPVTGVIPALSAVIRSLVENGDKIILQPPVYNHFYITIKNCGCEALENNLIYNDGYYSIDFHDLEMKAADPRAKLLLLSNPHNPAGRVWTHDELLQIGKICNENNVIVVSDEIHSDLVFNGHKHIPFASLSGHGMNSITLSSPSKSFNLAGLQLGYLFTENTALFTTIKAMLAVQEMELLSPFAIEALIAAYNDSEEWLEALKTYLYSNYEYLKTFVALHLPGIKVVPLEATYLVWLDCRALHIPSENLSKKMIDVQKLWVNPGTMYGAAGEGFLRINIACPLLLLKDGLERMKTLLII